MVVNVGALVWNFLGIILLTNVLSNRAYGAYVYASAWAALLAVPAALGLPHVVVRQVAAAHASGDHSLARGIIRRAYQWTLVGSAVVLAIGAVGGYFIGREEHAVRWAYLLGLVLIPIVALYELNESIMRGFRRVVQGRIASTTVQPLALIALLVGAWVVLGRLFSAGIAIVLTDIAAAVGLAVSFVLVRRAVPRLVRGAVPRYEHKVWLLSAAPLFVQSGGAAVHVQVSLILVGALSDVTSSGVFNTALRWAAFVSFVQTVVNYPLAPVIVHLHASAQRARLQLLLLRSARAAIAAAAPVALALIVFRAQALRVFGVEFTSGGTALAILIAGELTSVACGSVALALAMTGHEGTLARTRIAAVAINVGLGLALIPPLGIEGVAIARAVSLAWLNMVLVWQLWRREGISTAITGRRLLARLAPVGRNHAPSPSV